MDARELYRAVSDRMQSDFEITGHHNHMPTRGTAREGVLEEFLSAGRLPPKYGLGAGEVVGRVRDVSRQCDLIVYDKMDGLSLLYNKHSQIYPIDCVYGIIEVKSRLSKSELIDSLEKIKAFKKMSPSDGIAEHLGAGFKMVRARPKPFGIVFAHSLDKNSLDSLYENLKEWESENPADLWPNYVCVLGEGCMYHQHAFETCIDSERITIESIPVSIKFKGDSLFKFYCALHDMCARMRLGPVELSSYFDPALQIGRFVVSGHLAEVEMTRPTGPPVKARLKESTIERIVHWCAQTQKIRHWDVLKKTIGLPIHGMDENSFGMGAMFYIYNPENFPGMDEVRGKPEEEKKSMNLERTLFNAMDLVVDGQTYILPGASLPATDWDTF
jgi:hypothetical protein